MIENPISGERIVIHRSGAETDGALLAWELVLAPGGRVPSSHAHPEQVERFAVVSGRLRFRVGGHATVLGPGESVTVPAGTVHSFANAGREPVRVFVESTPALEMEALLETAAAMARDQRATSRPIPRLLDLLLFMRDFEREVRAPYLPASLVSAVTRPIAWLAQARGLDRRYRRLRARVGVGAST